MNWKTRRGFIKKTILTGAGVLLTPTITVKSSDFVIKPGLILPNEAVILFQGDSITDGNRGRNNDLNHIMGHGYAFSIASRISADFPEKNYMFYNRGISANKIIDLEKRWQTDTLDLKPDILSILIGINDSTSSVTGWEPVVSPEKYETIYDKLLEQTHSAFPEILFVLGEPFIKKGSRVNENWEAFQSDIMLRQSIVKKLAKKHNAVFVEFQKVFDEASKRAPVDYWIWDGVHPTVAGHELMAREWMKEVTKRIKF